MACEDLAREALEPFAKAAEQMDNDAFPDRYVVHAAKNGNGGHIYTITAGDLRRARTAYDAPVGESDELPMEMDPFGWARRHAPENLPANARHEPHPDDVAVDTFALAMKAKLAEARAKGKCGWQDPEECSQQFLSDQLRSHALKPDPLDVANFAMFLHQRGELIASLSTHTAAGAGPGCICQGCNRAYTGDLHVPDDVWERIKPDGKVAGAGLLCASCIVDRAVSNGIWTCARAVNGDAGAGPVGEASNADLAQMADCQVAWIAEGAVEHPHRIQTIRDALDRLRCLPDATPAEEPGEVERLTRERDEARAERDRALYFFHHRDFREVGLSHPNDGLRHCTGLNLVRLAAAKRLRDAGLVTIEDSPSGPMVAWGPGRGAVLTGDA